MSAPAYPPQIKTQPLARDGSLSFWWYPNTQAPDTWGYTIYDQTSTVLANVTSTVQTVTVTGLTNGQTYECWLSAGNIAGESPPAYFRPFQPGLPPTVAPTSATATIVGDSNVLIEWTPSGESLAAPIQWYAIKAVSSDPAASNFRYTADGLKPETTYLATNFNPYSYTFTVQGVNCPGYSPAAVTNSVNFGAGGSWQFDATGNQQLDLVIGTYPFSVVGNGEYTWECFFYITSFASGTDFGFSLGEFGVFQIDVSNTDITVDSVSFGAPSPSFTTGTWYHFAVARDSAGAGNNVAVWINGTRLGGTQVNTASYNSGLFRVVSSKTGVNGLIGYITNINVNYAALYDPTNATITPPVAPITPNGTTLILYLATDAGTAWNDSSGNLNTVNDAASGGVVWSSQTPF